MSDTKLGLSIALIVILGIVPALALSWVAVWLLFLYAGDRTCWCTKRRRKSKTPVEADGDLEKTASNETDQRILNQSSSFASASRLSPPPPPRGGGGGGDAEGVNAIGHAPNLDRTTHVSDEARTGSRTSNDRDSITQISQEPKPFV